MSGYEAASRLLLAKCRDWPQAGPEVVPLPALADAVAGCFCPLLLLPLLL